MWSSYWEKLGLVGAGWYRALGNHWGVVNRVTPVNGELRFGACLELAGCLGGKFNQRTMASASTSVPKELFP